MALNNYYGQRREPCRNSNGAYGSSVHIEEYIEEETYDNDRYYGGQYGAIGGGNGYGNGNGGGRYGYNNTNRYDNMRQVNGGGRNGYGGRYGYSQAAPNYNGIEIGSNNRTEAGANEVKLRFDLGKLKDIPDRNGGVLIGSQQFARENDNRIDFSEYDDSAPAPRRAQLN